MNDFIIPEKLKQNVQTGMSQNPTPIQRKMISKLAEELTEREYHELCHQLHGTKEEFDQEDGECSVPYNKYFYTVQSALYRGSLIKCENLDIWKKNGWKNQTIYRK